MDLSGDRRVSLCVWLVVLGALLWPHQARADLPVPYATVGCIMHDGLLTNRNAKAEWLENTALKALHGKTIRIEGQLSPIGFRTTQVFVVASSCRKTLLGSYLLCSPCQTMLNQPPSKLLPPREAGTAVVLPPAALDELSTRLSRRR